MIILKYHKATVIYQCSCNANFTY